jgi:hypothetical protein
LTNPKTPRRDGDGFRKRWRDRSGRRIYKWDYRHCTVEVYNRRGEHVEEFDPSTAEQLKGPNPDYEVEP